uniref:ULP_PROTEASE domain-containing protein n=1 Tax=Rhabditophanes sp. KR3021 TaxID=114890 RepID=A0AC35THH7_9BILA
MHKYNDLADFDNKSSIDHEDRLQAQLANHTPVKKESILIERFAFNRTRHDIIPTSNIVELKHATVPRTHLDNFGIEGGRLYLEGKIYLYGIRKTTKYLDLGIAEFIQNASPDCVLLELCNERKYIINSADPDAEIKKKGYVRGKLGRLISSHGVLHAFLHVIFEIHEYRTAQDRSIAPNSILREASLEGRKMMGTKVYFVDRDYNISIERLIRSLSCWAKIKLLYQAIFWFNYDLTAKVRLDNSPLLVLSTNSIFQKVWGNERDQYMAKGIYEIYNEMFTKKINAARTGKVPMEGVNMIVITDITHLKGIQTYYGTNIDILKLIQLPQTNFGKYVMGTIIVGSYETDDYDLVHNNESLALYLPFRLASITQGTSLELQKRNFKRINGNCTIRLSSGKMMQKAFLSNTSLYDMLIQFQIDLSKEGTTPAILTFGKEIVGETALKETTLSDIGIHCEGSNLKYLEKVISDEQMNLLETRRNNCLETTRKLRDNFDNLVKSNLGREIQFKTESDKTEEVAKEESVEKESQPNKKPSLESVISNLSNHLEKELIEDTKLYFKQVKLTEKVYYGIQKNIYPFNGHKTTGFFKIAHPSKAAIVSRILKGMLIGKYLSMDLPSHMISEQLEPYIKEVLMVNTFLDHFIEATKNTDDFKGFENKNEQFNDLCFLFKDQITNKKEMEALDDFMSLFVNELKIKKVEIKTIPSDVTLFMEKYFETKTAWQGVFFKKDTHTPMEVDDEAFELGANEIAKLQKDLSNEVKKFSERSLVSNTYIAERNNMSRLNAYKHSVFRIQVNSDTFIQGCFKSTDNTKRLYEFVDSILINKDIKYDLALVPNIVVEKSNTNNFIHYDLAPKTTFHLRAGITINVENFGTIFDIENLRNVSNTEADHLSSNWLKENTLYKPFDPSNPNGVDQVSEKVSTSSNNKKELMFKKFLGKK